MNKEDQLNKETLEEAVEFAENPEPRCACVLLLDTSGSMSGEKIAALNGSLQEFQRSLQRDALASKRVEIAIVSFGGQVEEIQDFVTADNFTPPSLTTSGNTPMAEAINRALDMIQKRKEIYKKNGVSYYRPWIFMITDGEPTDQPVVIETASRRVRDEEAGKHVAFFAVGVEGANLEHLKIICSKERPPLMLKGMDFAELFVWLSGSLGGVAKSELGDMVSLPPTTGWSVV